MSSNVRLAVLGSRMVVSHGECSTRPEGRYLPHELPDKRCLLRGEPDGGTGAAQDRAMSDRLSSERRLLPRPTRSTQGSAPSRCVPDRLACQRQLLSGEPLTKHPPFEARMRDETTAVMMTAITVTTIAARRRSRQPPGCYPRSRPPLRHVSHSRSFVQRRFVCPPRTAMATARFWPTSTTSACLGSRPCRAGSWRASCSAGSRPG